MSNPVDTFIHPLADVEKGAVIGVGTRIWRWTHVSATAQIGKDCSIGQGCYVGPGVYIRDHVRIQNNVSVFEGVYIGSHAFIGPSVVFTNVKLPKPRMKRRRLSTWVGIGAMIGANATILCGLVIGDYAVVGAGAVVTKPVPDGVTVVGNPSRRLK